MNDLLQIIDHRAGAELTLAVIGFALALVSYGVIRLKPSSCDRYASIPLSDHVEDPRSE